MISDIAENSAALIANFGATDKVLLALVRGRFNPGRKLPVELPSSMQAVLNQQEDVPYDTDNPLFPFGHGLHYNTQ